jgi:hypothetical protein
LVVAERVEMRRFIALLAVSAVIALPAWSESSQAHGGRADRRLVHLADDGEIQLRAVNVQQQWGSRGSKGGRSAFLVAIVATSGILSAALAASWSLMASSSQLVGARRSQRLGRGPPRLALSAGRAG